MFHLVDVEPIVAQCEERFMAPLIVRAAALATIQADETVLVFLAVAHATSFAWRAVEVDQRGADAKRQRRNALLDVCLAWYTVIGEIARIIWIVRLQHLV